jgi:cobalt-zinc-cadmium efflux system membrane fusion protein
MSLSSKKSIVSIFHSLPTIAVLGLLGIVGFYGHKHNWRWLAAPDTEVVKKSDGETAKPAAEPESNSWGKSPSDPTLTLTHDPAKCPYNHQEIRFKDADHIRRAGISVGKIERRTMETTLTVPACTDFLMSRVARIAPRVGGVLWRIERHAGDTVSPGELLAIIDSLDVGKAKAAYLVAKVQVEVRKQTRQAMTPGAIPQISIVQADAAVREAEVSLYAAEQGLLNLGLPLPPERGEKEALADFGKRLQFLGIPQSIVDSVKDQPTGNLLPILNPLKERATVLQREGSLGEPVAALQTLFIVGETNELIVFLDVRQEDARFIRLGMPVVFTPDGDPDNKAAGKIEGISNEVDSKTRTVRMRARIENPSGKLRAKTFGSATIVLDRMEYALTVQEAAIQWEGCSHVIFVLESDDGHDRTAKDRKEATFKVHRVALGIRSGGHVAIKPIERGDKLEPDEEVAESGSHVLKSYLFRERIGGEE